jgi:predicted nucleotidyltransferase
MLEHERLQHLAANERAALAAFVARLRQQYGDDLLRVVLFGSKARGDADKESDLDVLVVVRVPLEDYDRHWMQIVDLAWETGFERDLVFSPLIKDEAAYAQMQEWNLLINRNIEQDGVELQTFTLPAPFPVGPLARANAAPQAQD